MKVVGIFSLDPWTLLDDSSMKRELLYFDNLKYFITGKEVLEKFCNVLPNGNVAFQKRMKELEELEKVGLISEYTKQQFDVDYNKYKDEKTIDYALKRYNLAKEFIEFKQPFKELFIEFLESFREVGDLEARTNSIILNKYNDDEFIPIVKGQYFNIQDDQNFKKANVISVILKNFPEVPHDIETERLVDLKSDNEATLKLYRLKNWALDLTNAKLTDKEINQKIEYLLAEYQHQLDLHKLKYHSGIVETVITVGLEVFENIIKMNLSKAAKIFFDIQKKELALLEAEDKLLGKEVAYIHHLSENYNNP